MLGQPIFPGNSGVDQLVEIIKILGTPTREQIKEMNPNYTDFKFPQVKAHPWSKVSTVFTVFGITLTNMKETNNLFVGLTVCYLSVYCISE
jgi:hypothetical protein